MNEILALVLNSCSFLYNDHGFRFTDSMVANSFGGDAYLTLSRDEVAFRFVRDRGQMFLEVGAPHKGKVAHWYSFDLIRQLITEEREYYALMDEANVNFLMDNIGAIILKFSAKEVGETIKELNKLRLRRAKVLFGTE